MLTSREALSLYLDEKLVATHEFDLSHLSLWNTVLERAHDRPAALERIIKLQFSHLVDLHYFNVMSHDRDFRIQKPQELVTLTDGDDGSCTIEMTFPIESQASGALFTSLERDGIDLEIGSDFGQTVEVTATFVFDSA